MKYKYADELFRNSQKSCNNYPLSANMRTDEEYFQ